MFTKINNFLFGIGEQNLKQSIAKNTFWLFFGQITGRLLRVIVIIYAARILGPASWGAFSYAMSLVAFMTIISDFGINAIVTRESAKNLEKSNVYFSTAFFIKLALLSLGVFVIIFIAPWFTNIQEANALLPAIALILIFDGFRNFGFAIGRAKEKMQWEGINEILTNFGITALGLLFLWQLPTSYSLALGYAIAVGIGFLLIAWQLRDHIKNLFSHFDKNKVWEILNIAWPFALASSLGAIMINTDTIMLSWMRTPEEVGFYAAAQKPIQILYVFAGLFATSLFPTFVRLAKNSHERLKEVLEKAITISLLAALPISLGGFILGDQIINLIFGNDYSAGASAFNILILTIIVIFPSILISNSLFAHDQQKKFITYSLLGAVGNIAFNFLLIPIWGIAGCSLATLITQIISNGFIWKKMLEIQNISILPKVKKILAASLIMAIAVLFLKYMGANVLINILIAAAVYFFTLKILKERILMMLFD